MVSNIIVDDWPQKRPSPWGGRSCRLPVYQQKRLRRWQTARPSAPLVAIKVFMNISGLAFPECIALCSKILARSERGIVIVDDDPAFVIHSFQLARQMLKVDLALSQIAGWRA